MTDIAAVNERKNRREDARASLRALARAFLQRRKRPLRDMFALTLLLALLLLLPASRAGFARFLYGRGCYTAAGALYRSLDGEGDEVRYARLCAAQAQRAHGHYRQALAGFLELGDFEGSALEAKYAQAKLDEFGERYALALAAYTELGSFRDSAACLRRCEAARAAAYAEGISLIECGRYAVAQSLLQKLGEYEACGRYIRYATALELAKAGDAGAIPILKELGDFAESPRALAYCRARGLEAEGRSAQAAAAYEELAPLWDSAVRAAACRDRLSPGAQEAPRGAAYSGKDVLSQARRRFKEETTGANAAVLNP